MRKINIGISKKDIESYRSKIKSAFYNCFAVIVRIFHEGVFKEINIKLFNTGKLEIPGIQDIKTLFLAVNILTNIINSAGLKINNLEQMYLPSTPKIVGYNYWGTASS